MADANTSLYKFVKPEVGASADTWGAKLNTDFDGVDKLLGAITTAGSANAYTLTTGQSLAAYATGQRFRLKLSFSNTGSATLNVDGIGAKTIKKRDASTNVSSGDLASGTIVTVTYDGTNFVLERSVASDLSFQPLDATLTAWGGVTFAADTLGYSTGVDAFATIAFPSASRTQIAAGLGTASLVADGTSGAAYGKLNANKTDSGNNIFTGTNAFQATVTARNITNETTATYDLGDSTHLWNRLFVSTIEVGHASDSTLSRVSAGVLAIEGVNILTTATGVQKSGDTMTGNLTISGASKALRMLDTGAAADTGLWQLINVAGRLVFQTRTDADGAGSNVLDMQRSGTTTTLIALTANDVTIAVGAPTADSSVGFRRFAAASITTGTLAAADSGKCVYATGSVTAPNSVFSKGDNTTVLAGASARTITQGSGVTMTNGNTGATGSCTLAANGMCVIVWTSSSACTVFGNV